MLTLSKSEGIGGKIKERLEDFKVKEITKGGVILEPDKRYSAKEIGEEDIENGKFTTFVLQKRDWDTIQALISIAKRTGRGRKSIGYVGSKDKKSVSVQLASIFGISQEQLSSLKIKDISINGAWKSNGVELADNLGNNFDVVISQTRSNKIAPILEELDGRFPNYFDKQRFGSRLNNATVGLNILKGDFEEAVNVYLTDTSNETNEEAIDARRRLRNEQDFNEALKYFPRYLRNERSVIGYLVKDRNYANALRALPRGITTMFVHALEAIIFNSALEDRIKENNFSSKTYLKPNFYGFPDPEGITNETTKFCAGAIIGYETKEETISDYEREALDRIKIKKEDFKIRSMPELSMKGSIRAFLAPAKEVKHSFDEDKLRIEFSIPSGSYATIFLNEITKTDSLDMKI